MDIKEMEIKLWSEVYAVTLAATFEAHGTNNDDIAKRHANTAVDNLRSRF